MERMRKRRGFTLIEVMVALGIFLILILALVGSYYSYYNSVKQMAYKAIGQNIAELQLEDVRYLPATILDSLCKGGQYPTDTIWQRYTSSGDYYMINNISPDPDIPNAIPYPTDMAPDSYVYISGKTDGDFRLEKIDSILGVTDSVDFDPDASLQRYLPANIKITPVFEGTDINGNPVYDYTILLNKEVFPYYQKKIEIIDETPDIADIQNKIFKIDVTVYWTVGGHIDPSVPGQIIGGTTKHITLTTESAGQ
jgi:prepilin-type N-terminal cleavage/methylation domain-containing protein